MRTGENNVIYDIVIVEESIVTRSVKNEEAGAMGHITVFFSIGFHSWDGGGNTTSSTLTSIYVYGLCGRGPT